MKWISVRQPAPKDKLVILWSEKRKETFIGYFSDGNIFTANGSGSSAIFWTDDLPVPTSLEKEEAEAVQRTQPVSRSI